MQALRIAYAVLAESALLFLGVLYATAGKDIIALGEGEHSGPFTWIVTQLDTVIPIVIGVLMLAIVIWMVVAPVQQERRRRLIR